MTRALPLAAIVFAFASCDLAQRHPAVTSGIVGATMGFGVCAIDQASPRSCAIIGASAAVFLGGIVALVGLFADTTDHALPIDDEEESVPGRVRVHTSTPPPPEPAPIMVDAGVGASAPVSDAPAID